MITSRHKSDEGEIRTGGKIFGAISELSELEAEWARRLAEAEARAHASGRSDVADYLALRALNDVARNVGIEWLLATFTAHALQANSAGARIELTSGDEHRFRVGNSTMVGRLLKLTSGVRVLSIEAGWPRTPRDGIVRGGGLASARISHFGKRRDDDELLLMHDASRTVAAPPRWLILEATGAGDALEEARVSQHVSKLLA